MHTHGFAYADAHEQRAPGADAQPFRDECMCVLATFLAPSARKELLLDACVRDTAMKQLVWTTHPDVVSPLHPRPWASLTDCAVPPDIRKRLRPP